MLFVTSENAHCNINGSKVTRYQIVYIIISNILKNKRSRNYISIVGLFSDGVLSDYYFLKFPNLPLGTLCFYDQKGEQKEKQ